MQNEIEIIKALAEGVDPFTGEILPAQSPYNRVETVRALYKAMESLTGGKPRSERKRFSPAQAGQPWTSDESNLLVQRFDAGINISEIAGELQRTRGSIAARLVKIGKIQFRDQVL